MVMPTKQLLRSFELKKLAQSLSEVTEALLTISSWYVMAKGNYQGLVSPEMVKALDVMVTVFGPARTTNAHYLLRHGNDLTPSYLYQRGEQFTLRPMPGPYVTYTFEVCTWLARYTKLDAYLVLRLGMYVPCLFSHHYLGQCLRYLRELDPASLLGLGLDPLRVSRFVNAVYTCSFRYEANTEPPAYWVNLEDPIAIVVNYYKED
jgi:hypothetical protein